MKDGSFSKKLLEDDKKRKPQAYAKTPDMLWAMPMSWWVAAGATYPPMEQLFGPFWTRGELAVLCKGRRGQDRVGDANRGKPNPRMVRYKIELQMYENKRVTGQKCYISPHVVL